MQKEVKMITEKIKQMNKDKEIKKLKFVIQCLEKDRFHLMSMGYEMGDGFELDSPFKNSNDAFEWNCDANYMKSIKDIKQV